MNMMKHIQTWLLITLLALSANGAVSAKLASGHQNLSGNLHQSQTVLNALLHQGLEQVSTTNASGSPLAAKGLKPKPGSSGGPGEGKAFPKSVQDAARAESGNKCVFCGVDTIRSPKPHPRRSNIDHADPKSRGGNNTLDNAQNTCQTCNLSKGAKTTGEFLKFRKINGGG